MSCQIHSVDQIKYISDNYGQEPQNASAIDDLNGEISKIRSAETFDFALLLALFLGFVIDFFMMGRNLRRNMFEPILKAKQ